MANMKSKINFNKIRNTKDKLKAKLKKDNPKKEKNKKEKKPKNKRKIWYWILSIITGGAILVFLLLIAFAIYIVVKAPEFTEDKLYNKESTVLYMANGEELATLGMSVGGGDVEKRIKLDYDELPQVLIDAIIATEDARFFQHNGVDLARFLKASIGQVLGQSDAGGASTLTMQVSKNALTDTNSEGFAGIVRKFTDVYLSVFKIEKRYTKQDILAMYLNSSYLGGGDIYGVEQASQTYFGKSASELTLPEAALIAGLFQAPGAYDPYINPDKARARRNQVLNLMLRHGYINEEECEIAKSMPITEMLKPRSASTNIYQGYIDTVVEEVIDKYDVNPYIVPLKIYTMFDPAKQQAVDNLYNGNYGYKFKDDLVQVGIAVVDNKTGALVAVGAGRNRTGERENNYATMTNAHPGSTIKPLLDYGPAIEYLNWSTYTPLFDEPYEYAGGVMKNINGKYKGLVTAKVGLSSSLNPPALQTFQATTNEQKWNFVTSLGITPGNENGQIFESSSIGAFDGATPVALASAYSAIASGGMYIKAYTVDRIEYIESGDVVKNKDEKQRVMKETTAYMLTNILLNVTPAVARVSGTDVASKTGTSSYDDAAVRDIGIYRNDVIRDSWINCFNPDYTISMWYGYDKLYKDHYNTTAASGQRNKMVSYLTKNILNTGSRFTVPKGISSVTVELETIPAKLPSAYTPDNLKETHLFITGTEPTEESTRFSQLSNPTDLKVVETGHAASLTWTGPSLPDAVNNDYLTEYFASGYREYAQKYYDKRIEYNNAYIGTFGYDIYLQSGTNLTYVGHTSDTNFVVSNTTGYDSVVVKSAYSIFKDNASTGVTHSLTGSSTTFEIELLGVLDGNNENFVNPTYKVGDKIADIGLSTIKFVVGGVDLTDTISSSDKQYVIKNCTGNSCEVVTKIDNTVKGEYEIVYTINYLGTPYTKSRYIHIKDN